MQTRIAQIDLLARAHSGADRRLESGEMQALDIGRAPDIGQRAPEIVDAVGLPAMKYSQLAAQLPSGIPIERALVAPGAFRTQIRAADIGGIVVVQVRVAGNSKRPA